MNISSQQYQQMSRYERAQIFPPYYELLLWAESINDLSDYGKAELAKFRANDLYNTQELINEEPSTKNVC